MATKYWIKLYHEMLDDPKMGRLSDRLYRRVIEFFLLAGDNGKDGLLPPVDDMAWRLRCNPEHLETEIVELSKLGILSQHNGRWLVTKFSERQETMTKAEYMRRKRETEKSQEHYQTTYQPRYQSVTNGNTDIDIDRDIDKNKIEREIALTSALSSVAKETYAPGFNEKKYQAALSWLVNNDKTPEQVEAFGAWWKDNGWHMDRPSLTNVLDNWPDFEAGRCLRKEKQQANSIDEIMRALQEAE